MRKVAVGSAAHSSPPPPPNAPPQATRSKVQGTNPTQGKPAKQAWLGSRLAWLMADGWLMAERARPQQTPLSGWLLWDPARSSALHHCSTTAAQWSGGYRYRATGAVTHLQSASLPANLLWMEGTSGLSAEPGLLKLLPYLSSNPFPSPPSSSYPPTPLPLYLSTSTSPIPQPLLLPFFSLFPIHSFPRSFRLLLTRHTGRRRA
ncbi:hypothetical protein G7046_g1709 [Stylonectria norvegica]|nr:hypothetical protein G7046_g1709 [Stylonectria norvegica]